MPGGPVALECNRFEGNPILARKTEYTFEREALVLMAFLGPLGFLGASSACKVAHTWRSVVLPASSCLLSSMSQLHLSPTAAARRFHTERHAVSSSQNALLRHQTPFPNAARLRYLTRQAYSERGRA